MGFLKRYPGVSNILLFFVMLIILLGAAEIFFRINGKYSTFNEKYGKPYHSLFESDRKNWYHIYEPHQVTSQALKEYSYSLLANNEGLLDKDFIIAKKPHAFRIMVIGDSFVQGMGAVADSSLPKQLETILRSHFGADADIEVWNCGIGNSDPFFEYRLFADRLLKYQPDYVIEVVNFTDISDVMLRGGFKRFNADSSVTYNQPPWFEPLYAKSYLVRSVVHDVFRYNWQFLRPRQEMEARKNSEKMIAGVLSDFETLCSASHIPFLVAFHPGKNETEEKADYSMQSLISYCNAAHIPNFDIRRCMISAGDTGSKAAALYWPIDQHCNRYGYQVFAQCLSAPVAQYLDSLKGQNSPQNYHPKSFSKGE